MSPRNVDRNRLELEGARRPGTDVRRTAAAPPALLPRPVSARRRLAPHLFPHLAPAALVAAFLAACTAVGTDYAPPETELPAQWRESSEAAIATGEAELAGWWRALEDPLLDGLVRRAVAANHDLREALGRVDEARALRGVAAGERWPTVDGTLSYERRGESENTPLGGFVPDSGYYTAGVGAAWELDVWGRVRRVVEAADADLAATVEDARDVAVTVAAETALAYVDLRTFQQRLALARRNVALQEDTLALVRSRSEAGLVGERDVAQALTNLERTRARVPPLDAGARAAENRLAVLLGVAPGALADELAAAAPIPVPPAQVAVGVPADVLRRRPDVRRAERGVAAEHARIGVAEGDLYPRLTLAGEIGLAADSSSDLLEHDSNFFGLGPSLRWNLFDGGRLRSRVDAQESRAEQALVRWERTVLLALEETENAMTTLLRERLRKQSLAAAVEQARRSVALARTQYQEGITDFQAVLDSERALADLEDELALSDSVVAASFVSLCRALGGGWEPEAAS